MRQIRERGKERGIQTGIARAQMNKEMVLKPQGGKKELGVLGSRQDSNAHLVTGTPPSLLYFPKIYYLAMFREMDVLRNQAGFLGRQWKGTIQYRFSQRDIQQLCLVVMITMVDNGGCYNNDTIHN